LPFPTLDLSDFSLDARKLSLFLSSVPSGSVVFETLKCGRGVCTNSTLPVLATFLQRLKAEGERGAARDENPTSLKSLVASKCGLEGATAAMFLFPSLPRSLESLELGGVSEIFFVALQ